MGKKRQFKPPEYGVVIWSGLMGAGKSYMATRKVLEFILAERRPVFTNLPLRWRVVRQWLRNRGREMGVDAVALANLIQPIDEVHFRGFLKRQHEKHEQRERMLAEDRRYGREFSQVRFERWWREHYGPDRWRQEIDAETGEVHLPNWILPMSLIVIDEAHHWFPNINFPGLGHLKGKEVPELMFYLTMIRHHLHLLWIISQTREQVSKRFRDLAHKYIAVRQRGEDPLFGNVRLKHAGLRAFAYVTTTPESEAAYGPEGRPIADETVFYWMKKHRWYFRLYNSFTHMGGVRRMKQTIREVREQVGLLESGESRAIAGDERAANEENSAMLRWGFRIACLLIAFLAGVVFSSSMLAARMGDEIVKRAEARMAEYYAMPIDDALSGESEGPELVSDALGEWRSLNSAGVLIDSKVIRIGDTHESCTLLAVDMARKWSLWRYRDGVHVWMWGQPESRRIGSVERFAGYIEGLGRPGAGSGRRSGE